jgi:hypothetical protein
VPFRRWVRGWVDSKPYAIRSGPDRAEVAGFPDPPLIPAPTQFIRVQDAAFQFHAAVAAGQTEPTGLVDLSIYRAPPGEAAVGIERSANVLVAGP